MTVTANLGLPFIEAGQAQKHVTHNEALRILDAAIQIAVADRSRTVPPPSPLEGERHIVAAGAGGAWSGQAQAIATWQDGAWAFLAPKQGWCVWSIADDVLLVFDGAAWRDLRDLPLSLDNTARLGIGTIAAAPNLLSVKSNAALFAAIAAAAGGSGDVRLQLAKESAGNTASVVFSDAYSGRAEFGLVGSDAFKLKVSANGSGWVEALTIDPASGAFALPRAVALTGVIAPPTLTADHNDYAPAGIAAASVLQLSADAARSLTGLAGGAEGRVLCVINVGSQPVILRDGSAASLAANRFSLGGDLAIAGKQAAILRYDGTAQRWQAIAGGATRSTAPRGHLAGLTLSTAGGSSAFAVAAGVATDSGAADSITLAAPLGKTTAAWAAGAGNGALDTGTIAPNAWYHVHLIKRPDTGEAEVLISTSATAPALPSGYTLFRRIGAMKTNGAGQWLKFIQAGDEFLWDAPVLDVSGSSNQSTTPIARTLSVPPGVRVWAKTRTGFYGLANSVFLQASPDVTQVAGGSMGTNYSLSDPGNGNGGSNEFLTRTDINRQIITVASGSISCTIETFGWHDRRGQDG